MKKAAMFGLDARIALAIFGLLSIISGAALYSTINKTKAISIINEANEMSKGLEAFFVDTGQHLTCDVESSELDTSPLIKNSNIPGWKGPYVNGTLFNGAIMLAPYNGFTFERIDSESYSECTKSSKACYYWIFFTKFISPDIIKNVEKEIDHTKNPGINNLTGNFIYYTGIEDGKQIAEYALKTSMPYPPSLVHY